MKVLFILDPAVTGGATKSVMGLIYQLIYLGVDPIVCTSNRSSINSELSERGILNFAIGHREMITSLYPGRFRGLWLNIKKAWSYFYSDIKAFFFLRKHINIKEIDIIHTNSSRSDIGFFVSGLYKIPHVVHLREYGDLDYNCHPLNPFYINYYNAFANRFICVSDAIKRHWAEKGISANKMRVVYNGIDTTGITISSNASKDSSILKIVMCGVLTRSKGQHLAIEAMGLLPDDIRNNVQIDFIGWIEPSYEKKLVDDARRYGIENKFRILGPYENVLHVLGNYQIGLMCSYSEGFGRVTAEYMHAKLGVIASNSGANPELVEDGITGLLFENGNAASLSEKIKMFYDDRELLTRCSTEAQKKAEKKYTAAANASSVYDIYQGIMQRQL